MTNPNRPSFITVEGGEGAGKTTLINYLAKLLNAQGLSVIKTREPGGTLIGDEIRHLLLSQQKKIKIGAKAELLMFLAARAQHVEEVIAPAIAAGKVVLCDRFNDSTIAYQGLGRGLGVSFVRDLCMTACGSTVPDLTFYLDVSPEIGLERTKGLEKENAVGGTVDRIEAEKIEFHQKVRQAFAEIAQAEPRRFLFVNALQSKESVLDTCKNILEDRFGKKFA